VIPIDLSGRVALITGAGQGLGAAMARTLHRAGATVVINYFPDGEDVNRSLAEQLAAELGDRATAAPADVRDPAQVTTMVSNVFNRLGRLDIIVNNAGIIRDRTVKKMSVQDWQQVISRDSSRCSMDSQAPSTPATTCAARSSPETGSSPTRRSVASSNATR